MKFLAFPHYYFSHEQILNVFVGILEYTISTVMKDKGMLIMIAWAIWGLEISGLNIGV